jgi:predicted CoA-binding protein
LEVVELNRTIAIIGASNDRKKYGNKAVRAYLRAGWTVYPVNPRGEAVEGIVSYLTISDVPDRLDRVSMYVPPKVGLQLLDEIAKVNPGEVFFNPGSDSDEVMDAARNAGLNAVAACSIVDIGLSPKMFPDE